MWANEWLAEQHAADQRRFTQLLTGSFAGHALLLAIVALAPSPSPPPLPAVLRVDLVAGLPTAAPPAAAPAPAPAAKAPKPPAAIPPPEPVAPPKPPPPVPKQVVLPKEAPKAVPKKKVVTPPARPKEIEYDDALAQLRDELGEEKPSASAPAEDVSDEDLLATTQPAEGTSTGAANAGSTLDKETAAWVIATQRHVRNNWITPAEFLNRDLATLVEVELGAGGQVRGEPRVVRSSGDPFFDDNTVRAVMRSSPLPAPPQAGTWTFSFSGDR